MTAPRTGPPGLTVLGVHTASDAYPNVKYKIAGLRSAGALSVREINFPFTISRTARGAARAGLRLLIAHGRTLAAYLAAGRPERVFIPYPAAILLWAFSWMPRAWRPKYIVADAFISWYDTVVEDRRLVRAHTLIGRLLRRAESRAYRTADLILVDTMLNADYFRERFGLAPERLLALPLSIDEAIYRFDPYEASTGDCEVLFVGTFVPLQGVEVIVQAAQRLRGERRIRFRLIGDGQTAPEIVRRLARQPCPNLTWNREWHGAADLARAIRRADICLGIFGDGPKTQRVWPLKNYLYMATGRAVITGATAWAEELRRRAAEPPFATVPVGDAEALAAAIRQLADDAALRGQYARAARSYYESHLGAPLALDRLLDRLRSDASTPARPDEFPAQRHDAHHAKQQVGGHKPGAVKQRK